MPKLEVQRPGVGKPLLANGCDDGIVAVATDEPDLMLSRIGLPVLPLGNYDSIAAFILKHQELD